MDRCAFTTKNKSTLNKAFYHHPRSKGSPYWCQSFKKYNQSTGFYTMGRFKLVSQQTDKYSNSTVETVEKGEKYVQR